MSRACRPTRGSSWARWRSPTSTRSRGCRRRSPSTRRAASHNPRSTVGTVTEIYDYLRLLFARVGMPHCPNCGRVIAPPDRPTRSWMPSLAMPDDSRILILAPLIADRKGSPRAVFEDLRKAGFVRVRVDGEVRERRRGLRARPLPEAHHRGGGGSPGRAHRRGGHRPHPPGGLGRDGARARRRTADRRRHGRGRRHEGEQLFSQHFACPDCGFNLPEIEPRSFSFNSPHGACPECQGLGTLRQIDPELVVPNREPLGRAPAPSRRGPSRASEMSFGTQLLAAFSRSTAFALRRAVARPAGRGAGRHPRRDRQRATRCPLPRQRGAGGDVTRPASKA